MHSDNRVRQAIIHGLLMLTEHMYKLLVSRNPGPDSRGSFFSNRQTWQSISDLDWQPYDCPEVKAPCTAFWAKGIEGWLGLVEIGTMSDRRRLMLEDGHQTGFLSVVAEKNADWIQTPCDYAVIILGDEDGKEVVYTVHPGAPIQPSSLAIAKKFNVGDIITPYDALGLGFKYAKIRNPGPQIST